MHFLQSLRVNAGMLADVHGMKVKTEGTDFSQQGFDKQRCQPSPAICAQAVSYYHKIGFQFSCRTVRVSVCRRLSCVSQPRQNAVEEKAVDFAGRNSMLMF